VTDDLPMPVRVALSRPLGWDTVLDSDDCRCPKGGTHQPGCDYYDPPAGVGVGGDPDKET
jgi:hypothetical protein